MVQIQVIQKPKLVDLEDAKYALDPASPCASKHDREQSERVERSTYSTVKSLMLVATALLMVMMVSRMLWIQKQVEDVGKQLEVVSTGYGGHEDEVGKTYCSHPPRLFRNKQIFETKQNYKDSY